MIGNVLVVSGVIVDYGLGLASGRHIDCFAMVRSWSEDVPVGTAVLICRLAGVQKELTIGR